MTRFLKETEGIYRLKIPFDTLYTSVFLVETESGRILVDCATTREDVDGYIVPALEDMNLRVSDIDILVLTHSHGDHAGGKSRIMEIAPNIRAVTDVCELLPDVCAYALPGHTLDLVGVLDMRTGTLISGDGLQGAGVDKYRTYTESRDAYLKTLEKVRSDYRIENILFSHAYEPWYEDSARGRERVDECIADCFKSV
jgi:glyoxylase-like metal-dependent hydrolase (beta-lactamase superfamily II)